MPAADAEPARARVIELFPRGFEEAEHEGIVELALYTDRDGEARLRSAFGEVSAADVVPGWEDRWRDFHHSVRVGRLWVGPPWERPPAHATAVVIEPGSAFGTGAHATTRLALELLLELAPASVVDVGCGSGVLSVAAAKLGFAPVLGVDRDPTAVEATRANADANGVDVEVGLLDALVEPVPAAAVALVNIGITEVRALAPRVNSATLVTTGYFESETGDLPGFDHVERRTLGGWAADLHLRG